MCCWCSLPAFPFPPGGPGSGWRRCWRSPTGIRPWTPGGPYCGGSPPPAPGPGGGTRSLSCCGGRVPVRGSRGRSLSDLTTINAYKSHLIVTKLPPSFTSWLDWFTHYTYKPVCFGELSICFNTMCLIQIYKHTMKFHQRYIRTFLCFILISPFSRLY